MPKRFMLLFAGVVVAYFAIYTGDNVHMWVVTDSALPRGERYDAKVWSILLCLILGIVGIILWVVTMVRLLEEDGKYSSNVTAVCGMFELICLSFFFGTMAAPFSNYGIYPWYWTSGWDWLPLLALVPTALAAYEMLSEIKTAHDILRKR
jgi:hypothetical protein